jgi:hypothetical protein
MKYQHDGMECKEIYYFVAHTCGASIVSFGKILARSFGKLERYEIILL